MAKKLSRRDFLKGTAAVGLGAYGVAALPLGAGCANSTEGGKSKVVVIQSPKLLVDAEKNTHTPEQLGMTSVGQNDPRIDQSVLNSMMSKGMKSLTGAKSDADAWKKLFKPEDVVGIKVNCIAGRGLSTHPEVVASIIAGLKLAGVKPENIIVWDRTSRELINAGYAINRENPGPKVYGTDGDFDAETTKQGSFEGHLSKILSTQITALINVPLLKDHGGAGITGAMKNHYGSHDNPGPYHVNNCDPGVAEMSAIPVVKEKTRLIVFDAVTGTCDRGPGCDPNFVWEPKTLMFSTDPVAVDYQAWQMIDVRRKEVGLPTLEDAGRPPKWLITANNLGLGTNDPAKMEIVQAVV